MKSKGKACCFLPSSVCRMKSGTFGNICGKFCKPPLKNNFMTVTYIMQEYIIDSQHYFSLILKYKSSCWKFYKLIKYFISLYRKEWGTCWWKREIENPLAFYMPPNDLCQCCLKKKMLLFRALILVLLSVSAALKGACVCARVYLYLLGNMLDILLLRSYDRFNG